MKNTVYFLFLCFFGLFFSCTNKKTVEPVVPKEVEYILESTTSAVANGVAFANESGGTTMLDEVNLPYSYKFVSSTPPRSLQLSGHISPDNTNHQISGKIVVNGQVVKEATGNGIMARVGIAHVFN